MALRLGITGMDPSTEAELRSAFERAQGRLGQSWQLVPEDEADHVVVDMDSMYGPMSWIRLHAAGKRVIGLTTSSRTQADHRLPRPFDTDALATLLGSIAARPAATIGPSVATPDPETPMVDVDSAPAVPAPEAASTATKDAPAMPGESAAATAPAAATAAKTGSQSAAPPEHGFAGWLVPGVLTGRWRLARGGASVAFDADARIYHGPAALKPLAPLFEGSVPQGAIESLDASAWSSAAADEAQPLSRLQWYGALLAGKGRLLPGNDPEGRYRLLKWPQTEREFPKHFRIATAMMKGPATVAEIAAASGVAPEEVADFVNANLATGYAECVPVAPPEAAEPPRSGGLFGRLRGR